MTTLPTNCVCLAFTPAPHVNRVQAIVPLVPTQQQIENSSVTLVLARKGFLIKTWMLSVKDASTLAKPVSTLQLATLATSQNIGNTMPQMTCVIVSKVILTFRTATKHANNVI